MKKTTNEEIFRQREKLEQLKLKMKYEQLGYTVSIPKQLENGRFTPDLHAKNEETGDEIIFEIKFRSGLKRIRKGDILQMRDLYLQQYKHARFILVLPNEIEEKTPVDSVFNDLLLNYLEENHISYFSENIIGFINLERIEELVMNYVDFNNFQNISVRGEANLRFMIFREEMESLNMNLADGIPFQFNVILIHNNSSRDNDNLYKISKESKIIFDLSEFRT